MPTVRIPRLILPLSVIATVAVLLAIPRDADAGSYRAMQCHRELGAGHADASWSANSPRYVRASDCSAAGLLIRHEGRNAPTSKGRYGAWTLTAPTGTQITRVGANVTAQGQSGHLPQMLVTLASGATRAIPGVRGSAHQVGWAAAGGRSLIARLTCTANRGCGEGREARLALRRISLTLRDLADPTLGIAGPLLGAGSHRGTAPLVVNAQDAGSGVHSVTAEANGEAVAARVQDCAIEGSFALRLRPCPGAAAIQLDLNTASPPFHQGRNAVRVCASDHATTQGANLVCETRAVRIDNLCPVSELEGAALTARFAGGGSRRESAGDRPAPIDGQVFDAAGQPLAGARVCVASQVQGTSAERVVATPVTGEDGRYRAILPAGPSRLVRVAHWAGPDTVRERFLALHARAVPRLKLRPRSLRNGERLRFAVRLPGPAAADRRVLVQARSDGRWITADEGSTGPGGAWRGSYRFRSTTGSRTYSFRAVVPRQAGYPYLSGRSRTRHARVSG